MSDVVFQIESQSELEIVLVRTTLEEATDVTYTLAQFGRIFNNDEYESVWKTTPGHYSSFHYHYINFGELERQVLKRLETSKEVSLLFTDTTLEHLSYSNPTFKKSGFMFRPSKGVFVKWVEKPKKKVVSKAVLNDMKGVLIGSIRRYVMEKYGFKFEFQNCCNEKNRADIIRFGQVNGFTWDWIDMEPNFSVWWSYDAKKQKGVNHGQTIMEYLTIKRNIDPELVQPTYDAFKRWYVDNLK